MLSFLTKHLKNWQEKLRPVDQQDIFLEKLSKIIFIVILSLFLVFIFSQKTDLANSDLGRHLENGRLVWQEKQILYQNFYSYTEPEHRFINHHWLSGVIFYQVYQLGGFVALTIFNIILALIIFWLFFYLAYKKSSFFLAGILSLPVVLLMSERLEIRPEMFSVLFLGISWLILESTRLSFKKKTGLLFFLFVLWSNLHIYFFLGLALVFFYAAHHFLQSLPSLTWPLKHFNIGKGHFLRAWHFSYQWFLMLGALIIASLFNPNHIRGLFYPLNIFRNYGYEIVENKSIFFLQNLVLNYNFVIFKILILLLVASFIVSWIFTKEKKWQDWLLSIFIIVLGLLASRNLAIFGLVALVIISSNLAQPLSFLYNRLLSQFDSFSYKDKIIWSANFLLILLASLSFLFIFLDSKSKRVFLNSERGWGLYAGSEVAFSFFKENNLQGPIFNNYDAGSALIFGLPLTEKVFVDNRPEAYSVDFFQGTYLPMQLDEDVWLDTWRDYGFKTIFFSHTDGTNWGKKFVIDRLQDPKWALIYFDPFYMILIDKSAYDEEFINQHSFESWSFRQQIRSLSNSSDLNLKFYLAEFSQAAGHVDIAEEIYRQIILKNPNNLRALLTLGQIYLNSDEAGDIYKAIDYFEKVIKKEKRMPLVYSQLGLAHWRLLNYQAAEDAWRRAPRKDKTSKEYLQQIKDLKKQGLLSR